MTGACEATVLVPTLDHGPTLRFSLASALAQTVEDIEVFVVGDGCPPTTCELVEELAARDGRLRFFDRPKGERHGEAHRHEALAEARGRVVAYLCDDDLWHPTHLESLIDLLAESDFAHTLPLAANADMSLHVWTVDLALAADRRLILDVENRIPLSFVGHTLDFYRSLPRGWHPAPAGNFPDHYFYRQCLGVESCRAASGTRLTGVHFPSPDRRGWTEEERLEELELWSARVRTEWTAVLDSALQSVARDRALLESRWREEEPVLRRELSEMSSYVAHARAAVIRAEAAAADRRQDREALVGSLEAERAARASLDARMGEVEADLARTSEELRGTRATATWRLHDRLLDAPGAGLARALARRLSGPPRT